jgi:hypothetical protein
VGKRGDFKPDWEEGILIKKKKKKKKDKRVVYWFL